MKLLEKKKNHNTRNRSWIYTFIFSTVLYGSCATVNKTEDPIEISGIYPHLAMYNNEGEAGTGAVVPWADRLWVITYGPHLPNGSSDKLYEINSDLKQVIRPESIGGTPANRMIHKESQQLFIGPYAISKEGDVRTIPYKTMPGRMTGNARHLSKPADFIYYGTMEEGFYEVDVKTLDVKTLYEDANAKRKKGQLAQQSDLLPGAHGKGLYSGQGVMVYSNNGEATKEALHKFDVESGALLEWDGKDWKLIRRNQFTEVTGPGGIYGNENPATDPIWAVGWDHKSILLGVRGDGKWKFFRMPKASHSYDGAHGWNTEWPRIRNVGTNQKPDYLMTMHGMFWQFPQDFSINSTKGIRPRTAYLKVIGDFTKWDDKLVFGTDDAAQNEFLNKRKAKGKIEGAGQSNSNLWFTSLDQPDKLGPNTAEGSVWQKELIDKNIPSEPMLFAGWDNKVCWLSNHSDQNVEFSFEVDVHGNDQWKEIGKVKVGAGNTVLHGFLNEQKGEWIRVKTDKTASVTAHFVYKSKDKRSIDSDPIFAGISKDDEFTGGLLYSLGNNRRALGLVAYDYQKGIKTKVGYYELDDKMNLAKKTDDKMMTFIEEKFAIPEQVIDIESSSVLIVDDKGRRWRLPLGDQSFNAPTKQAALRLSREVVTERDVFNCHGTFYELPAENADGYAKIRPISSHNFKINDYNSYRGMMIMTGIDIKDKAAQNNKRIFVSDDQKAAVWAGAIDDLWKLGKPIGHGGPWKDTKVNKGIASDPYLIGFYDRKTLTLSHNNPESVQITIEVDPGGEGNWMSYKVMTVKSGEELNYEFPQEFEARWIRFVTDQDCQATAWLDYN